MFMGHESMRRSPDGSELDDTAAKVVVGVGSAALIALGIAIYNDIKSKFDQPGQEPSPTTIAKRTANERSTKPETSLPKPDSDPHAEVKVAIDGSSENQPTFPSGTKEHYELRVDFIDNKPTVDLGEQLKNLEEAKKIFEEAGDVKSAQNTERLIRILKMRMGK
jgi:hypothetical protein